MLQRHQHNALLIKSARIIDPANARDEIGDVAITRGVLTEHAPEGAHIIDATGKILCPGLMDIHVHLRDPGQTHKECIASGTAAAAAGGFTFVACMPNTQPPLDSVKQIYRVLKRAEEDGSCEVGPIACITKNRAGKEVVDIPELYEAGAVAFSDDGTGVESDDAMREAFTLARKVDAVLVQHCEYKHLSKGGVMHLGEVSERLGLPGLDPRSEEAMIERDIALCRETGGRYHVAHVSTKKAIELVRAAKREGLPVTSEVCTHHLVLSDEDVRADDPNTKMHPPLRPKHDVEACVQGLLDGTIDCIVTDHAPHTADEKAVGFLKAPPGIIGLETAVALAARAMIDSNLADWPALIRWFTTGPARVLGVPYPGIRNNLPANLTLIDPDAKWTVEPEKLLSRSKNTPFAGWELTARPIATIRENTLHACDDTL